MWQSHLGRCGGDGRRHQANEAVKLVMKRLVLSSLDPAGCALPKAFVYIDPPHRRQDNSRPENIYDIGNGIHRKDYVTDGVVTSEMQRSCLLQSAKSSDRVICPESRGREVQKECQIF